MDVLRCKTVEGVGKEMAMSALVYNLVRLVMLEASRRQRVRVNPHRPDRVEPQEMRERVENAGNAA